MVNLGTASPHSYNPSGTIYRLPNQCTLNPIPELSSNVLKQARRVTRVSQTSSAFLRLQPNGETTHPPTSFPFAYICTANHTYSRCACLASKTSSKAEHLFFHHHAHINAHTVLHTQHRPCNKVVQTPPPATLLSPWPDFLFFFLPPDPSFAATRSSFFPRVSLPDRSVHTDGHSVYIRTDGGKTKTQ